MAHRHADGPHNSIRCAIPPASNLLAPGRNLGNSRTQEAIKRKTEDGTIVDTERDLHGLNLGMEVMTHAVPFHPADCHRRPGQYIIVNGDYPIQEYKIGSEQRTNSHP